MHAKKKDKKPTKHTRNIPATTATTCTYNRIGSRLRGRPEITAGVGKMMKERRRPLPHIMKRVYQIAIYLIHPLTNCNLTQPAKIKKLI